MPVFDTPAPILAVVDLDRGDLRLEAGDRDDTVVEVHPSDDSDPDDVATAKQAEIDYVDGHLTVTVRSAHGSGAARVEIKLPAGSQLHGKALAADVRGAGRVGACKLTLTCGDIELEETGELHLTQVLGDVTIDHARGDVESFAEGGDVRIRTIEGSAQLNRTMGGTRIGHCTGDLYFYSDSGDLDVGIAHGAVEARATQGDIRIRESRQGPLVLETETGSHTIGIPTGAAAHLDLDAHLGNVHWSPELLEETPGAPMKPVHIRAHTIAGDIVVNRSDPEALDPDW